MIIIFIYIINKMKKIFCDLCKNLIVYNLNNNKTISIKCNTCSGSDFILNEDEFIFSNEFDNSNVIDNNIIYDCAYQRTYNIKCITCNDNTEMIIINLNPDSTYIHYYCTKCHSLQNT